MKLSIITVVYNDCQGIKNTLKSIILFAKKFRHEFELIIVNGNSTDNTDFIIKSYINDFDKNLTVYINESDAGIYDAMNKGVVYCSRDSDFCIFMNSGDCFNSKAATVLTNFFDSYSNSLDIAIFPIESIDAIGKAVRVRKFSDINKLRVMPVVPHQSTLIRTRLMKSTVYDLQYKILADYDFFCKCYLKKVSIEYFKTEPIAVFRQGGVSNKYIKQIDFILEIVRIQNKNFNKVYFRYLFIPFLKWVFFRFYVFRRLEFVFRKLL